jgi:asparagine synthase (glutamine-hydrolysing)
LSKSRSPRRHRDFANLVMDRDARTSLPDELLMYTDKVAMHFSLECRVPFLDLELASFLQRLRSDLKVGLWKRKKLQHTLLRRWLPGVALSPKKNGFYVPSSAWFGGRAAIRRRLLSRDSAMADVFDMSEVERIVESRDAGVKSDKHLFMLAAIGMWFDRHYRPDPAPAGV